MCICSLYYLFLGIIDIPLSIPELTWSIMKLQGSPTLRFLTFEYIIKYFIKNLCSLWVIFLISIEGSKISGVGIVGKYENYGHLLQNAALDMDMAQSFFTSPRPKTDPIITEPYQIEIRRIRLWIFLWWYHDYRDISGDELGVDSKPGFIQY